jgi:GGDEF domain-containing protein
MSRHWRLGGDEFTVLLSAIEHNEDAATVKVMNVVLKMRSDNFFYKMFEFF